MRRIHSSSRSFWYGNSYKSTQPAVILPSIFPCNIELNERCHDVLSEVKCGCLITVSSVRHFENPGVPFNPLRSYIPMRRNSYPDALLSDGYRKGGTGLARGAWTSAGNNSGKRRHIERAKESLPEKSTVHHNGHIESQSEKRDVQNVSNSFRLPSAKLGKMATVPTLWYLYPPRESCDIENGHADDLSSINSQIKRSIKFLLMQIWY